MDNTATVTALLEAVTAFRDAREWRQFHSPKNLAMSIAIEAAELMELYQWHDTADPYRAAEELADVLIYALSLADVLQLDVSTIITQKIAKNGQKYPVAACRGKA